MTTPKSLNLDLTRSQILRGDCIEVIKRLPDASVDAVVTDPPYGYLKHKLDADFDEDALFSEFDRVLKPNGAIVMFGRGVPFFRRCVKLDALGFVFKESVCWDKKDAGSSPTAKLLRAHEDAVIFGRKGFSLRKRHVPYAEIRASRENGREKWERDIAQLSSALKHPEKCKEAVDFLRNGRSVPIRKRNVGKRNVGKKGVTHSANLRETDRTLGLLNSITTGFVERDIIRVSRDAHAEHGTQKPVRLMERLVSIVSDEGVVVLDPFAGSGSTVVACAQTGSIGIGIEVVPEYAEIAERRLKEAQEKGACRG